MGMMQQWHILREHDKKTSVNLLKTMINVSNFLQFTDLETKFWNNAAQATG